MIQGPDHIPLGSSSANAAAANNQTLAGVAGKTTYCTGFEITGLGATAASAIVATLTGITGGPWSYQLSIPTIASGTQVSLIVEFAEPVPAAGPNTAIALNVPSFGAGNLNAASVLHGFQQ